MRNGTPKWSAVNQPLSAAFSRREALLLLGGAALSAALAGCGGSGSGSAGGVTAGNSNRTAIAGDLKMQYNQFSTIVQGTTDTWLGSSPALDALRDLPGRSSRAPADVKTVIQALTIGTNATRSAYERLCDLALMLDDLGSAAAAVTKNNSLSASNAVNNEQWLTAMIAQNYSALSVTGTLFILQMLAGLPEARAWVLARTGDADRLAAYGLVADVFNTWVDLLTAAGNIKPKDAWKLDLTAAVTPTNLADKLGAIDAIITQLPYSPGYRTSGATLAQVDDSLIGATGVQNFSQTFTGALARLTLSSAALTDTFPQTVDTTKAHYDVTARLGQTGVGQQLAAMPGGLAAAQSKIDSLLTSTDGTSWPGVTADSAACQVQIVGKTYGFIQALTTALITTQSALGSLITGAQALQFLNDLETTIATCATPPQKARWDSIQADRDLLKSQQLYNGAVPTTRKVDVVRVTGRVELDQVAAAGVVCTNTIMVCPPDICPLDPTKPDVVQYRTIISGLQKLPDCPRTFCNVLICVAGLLYDIAVLYPDTVAPKWTSSTMLMVCSATFARALRREPQATFAEIPAISSAQLLCSGVGFIPSRTLTPVDLGAIPTMPDLTEITNLVGGVPINVH